MTLELRPPFRMGENYVQVNAGDRIMNSIQF